MLQKILLLTLVLVSTRLCLAEPRDTLDLSGEWLYFLLNAPASTPAEGSIILPATLDNARKSVYNPESDNTSQLRREYSYAGEAIYSKEITIPESWRNKVIALKLERSKPSRVFVDGEPAGSNSRISSAQRYNLSEMLTPGVHSLEIILNNADSIPPIVARSSHAVSESTQTNWNGILGEIILEAKNKFRIEKLRIDDSGTDKTVTIGAEFSESSPQQATATLMLDGKIIQTLNVSKNSRKIEFVLPVDREDLWSASNPRLHDIEVVLENLNGNIIDKTFLTTGFRDFSTSDKYFTINGEKIFLRGTVNAAVFPLTSHAPMDKESWIDYFSILKDYGINHVRFHSWTPPKEAFQAADIIGIYIMTELPIWGELDRDLKFHNRFLKEELQGIMEAYSIHPSFVMFSTGNELFGDISLMGEYMKEAKRLNPRLLATYGSNVYLGMNGEIGGEDFVVAAKSSDEPETSLRGSDSYADTSSGGYINSHTPGSYHKLSEAVKNIQVPVVSHEVGQYQSFPDFREIQKYTGNLKADNLKEFRSRVEQTGMLRKSAAFHDASGKWVAKLYKAEMEMAMRTPGIAGYELFGLQDYPGQGTAIVGILNPFMESKGFVTPLEWRQSSSDVIIMAEFPEFTFTSGEIAEIPVFTVNYSGKPDPVRKIDWETSFDHGSLKGGAGSGIIENGVIRLTMPKVMVPKKFTLELSTFDSETSNSYDFWVYPKSIKRVEDVIITTDSEYALKCLEKGKKVILCPDSVTISAASLDPLFITDFWNYRMFRTICDEMNLTPSPGTLGMYINSTHPALKFFPTDNHTDWQWYSIVRNSRPLIIDRLPYDIDPIVEVIDNVERNFRLALLLECNVGKGKLIILSSNLHELRRYPEGRWLLHSLEQYVAGKDFKPSLTLTPAQVTNLLTKPSNSRLVKELKNETYNSHWD